MRCTPGALCWVCLSDGQEGENGIECDNAEAMTFNLSPKLKKVSLKTNNFRFHSSSFSLFPPGQVGTKNKISCPGIAIKFRQQNRSLNITGMFYTIEPVHLLSVISPFIAKLCQIPLRTAPCLYTDRPEYVGVYKPRR